MVVAALHDRLARMSKRRLRPARDTLTSVMIGTFTVSKKGVPRIDWADPYHLAVALSWPSFLSLLLGIYLGVNALFALAYVAVPGAVANTRPYHFADAFFFSLETLATVGYGDFHPATLYGHLVASMEIITGVAFTAILTGLVFVRFARPRAKFVFARNPVITTHNGGPTLMLRVGNGRASALNSAAARITALIAEITAEGTTFRRTHELPLERATLPVFALTWTLIHRIDKASPLHGLTAKEFRDGAIRFFVAFEARDPDLATTVHDMRAYGPDEVLFGMRYVDIISTDDIGQPTADLTRIDEVEPGPD